MSVISAAQTPGPLGAAEVTAGVHLPRCHPRAPMIWNNKEVVGDPVEERFGCQAYESVSAGPGSR